ncbi:MAG: hypothetical protein ACXW2A_11855, partial [Burkholderiales bacterium]
SDDTHALEDRSENRFESTLPSSGPAVRQSDTAAAALGYSSACGFENRWPEADSTRTVLQGNAAAEIVMKTEGEHE